MSTTLQKNKIDFILGYIDKLENQFLSYEENLEICENENYTFGVIHEIINIFKEEIPELEGCASFNNVINDANIVIGILKKYLVNNGYNFNDKKKTLIQKFWTSFFTSFEYEFPKKGLLKDEYIEMNMSEEWPFSYIANIDYDYHFRLHYGIDFDKDSFNSIRDIKLFIELSYNEWIKPEKKYDYTKEVNSIFKKYKLPFKLQKGKIVSVGYKTTFTNSRIINYLMLERKIQFSEEMIMSSETLDKKAALDYIVDSLLYIISIQSGEKDYEKYENTARLIHKNKESKQYKMIYNEIKEIIKISNEYFDIRHNEYLNKAKEVRKPLSDPIFIEYLYNRVYALLYIIKINTTNSNDITF